jgi:hypothetical protein
MWAFARNSRKKREAVLGKSSRFNLKQPDACVKNGESVQSQVSSYGMTQLIGDGKMAKKSTPVSTSKIIKADPKSIGLQKTGKMYIKP